MAKVLFKSWFVDFDPVRAKAEGLDYSLPKLILDFFPDSFDDSELGDIPKGWRVGKYSEVLSPSSARIREEDALEYSATVGGLILREQRFNKQLSKSRTKNKKIVKGDLVFGLSRKVLNFGLMKEAIGSVSPVYEVFKINTDVYDPELLEMYIRHNMLMHIDILKPGAREGQPIDRNYLLSKNILIPDMKVQKLYQGLFSQDYGESWMKEIKSQTGWNR